jgi:predicted DNA-binding transcriptional regulator AlpA
MKGSSSLPVGYSRCVLGREQAAEYVGVSPSLFDEMVADRRMPEAVVLSERRFGWIQRELDAAVAVLPRKGQAESHADVAEMSSAEKVALERFDATRKADKAEKPAAQY